MRRVFLSVCLASLAVLAPFAGAQDGLTNRPMSMEQFRQIRELTRPQHGENPWEKIHWVPTLHEAHEKAAREGKPIVVFTTGGEPLGVC